MWDLLFAQVNRAGSADPFRNPEVIWATIGLAVALLAGALLVYLADRWRKGSVRTVADSTQELTEFRRMFQNGEITEEEYARLRDKVANRVKAPPPAPVSLSTSQNALSAAAQGPPAPLPGPDEPTPPPDSGKPANPSSPA